MPHAPPTLETSIANGRYVLKETLGEGGFARVYRAWDKELMVARAIKILIGAERKRMRQRLKAEARAMARVGHPNVLRVYDIGADDQFDYVVMELAEGGALADQVERHGPLSARDAIAYAVQVLAALDAAHNAGVIHRDVKPSNVLIDRTGTALLADFGIALVDWGDIPHNTRTGTAMGTLAYMAPEQRLDAKKVGPAADIYAVGTTLFHLVTATTPFDLFMAASDSPRWATVPSDLRDVLLRTVKYDPAQRYETARHLATALNGLLDVPMPDRRPPVPWVGTSASPESTARARTLLEGPLPALPPLELDDATGFGRDPITEEVVASLGMRPLRRQSPLLAGVLVAALFACTLLAVAVGTALPNNSRPEGAIAAAVTPAPGAISPIGRWTGTINGDGMELRLEGRPEQPAGSVSVRLADALRETPVIGRYDAEARRLVLTDTPGSGEYTGTISEDGGTLRGTWAARGSKDRLNFLVKLR